MSEQGKGEFSDLNDESSFDLDYESCTDIPEVIKKLSNNYNNLLRKIEYGGLTMGMVQCFGIPEKTYADIIEEARSDDMFIDFITVVEATHNAMLDSEINITQEECDRAKDLHTQIMSGIKDFGDETNRDFALLKSFASKVDMVYKKLREAGYERRDIIK